MIEIKVSKATLKRAFDICEKAGVGACIAILLGQQQFFLAVFLFALSLLVVSLVGTEVFERRNKK